MASRRQRREAAHASSKDKDDIASIPLAQPPRNSTPSSDAKPKTLYEIASERQAELLGLPKKSSEAQNESGFGPNVEFINVPPPGETSKSPNTNTTQSSPDILATPTTASSVPAESNDIDLPLPPFPDTVFLSLPLSFIHFTLAFLAAHQYAQDIEVRKLLSDTFLIAFPILTFLVHFSHGHIISFDALSLRGGKGRKNDKNKKGNKQKNKQENYSDSSTGIDPNAPKSLLKVLFPLTGRNLIFLPLAIFLGARLISMANEASYYAMMKSSPAIGTLWAWAVLEVSAGPAVLGLLVPVGWAVWWKGYALY